MTWVDLSLLFGLGIASSLHCAQMCGPLVLSYSLRGGPSFRAHAFYNLGRITTYALLGAAAGMVGSVFRLAGSIAGIEQSLALIAGLLMIAAGIVVSGIIPRTNFVQIKTPSLLSRTAGRLLGNPKPLGKLWLGLALGFLPCGLVYAALMRSLAAPNPIQGALAMIAFGLGTSFSLIAVGMFSSLIGAKLGRWSNHIAAAGFVLMGVVLLWHGFKPVTVGPNCHH